MSLRRIGKAAAVAWKCHGGPAMRPRPVRSGRRPANINRRYRGHSRSDNTHRVQARWAAPVADRDRASLPDSVAQGVGKPVVGVAFPEFGQARSSLFELTLLAQLFDAFQPLVRRKLGPALEFAETVGRSGWRVLSRLGLRHGLN